MTAESLLDLSVISSFSKTVSVLADGLSGMRISSVSVFGGGGGLLIEMFSEGLDSRRISFDCCRAVVVSNKLLSTSFITVSAIVF